MGTRAFLALALFALSACSTTQRALSYETWPPDADVFVGNQRFQVWFHERDQAVLVVRGDPQPLASLLAQNATIYANDNTLGPMWWGAAANAVLTDIGCYGEQVSAADSPQMREVTYVCDPPTDVGAHVAQRRETWRRGMHVPAPAGG